jgi:hypothetical protein
MTKLGVGDFSTVTTGDFSVVITTPPWDIYYCIRNCPGHPDALAEGFKPYREHGLVKEGLGKIARHFSSEKHIGPKFVADFEEVTDLEERELLQRDAYERVNYLLERLGIKGKKTPFS